MLRRLLNLLMSPYTNYKKKQEMKKRLEEIRKRDPFIYK
jgi:hypothetical protein